MLTVLAALGYGIASALVPVLNAEIYAAVAGRGGLVTAAAAVLGLAAGQTLGKLVLFEAARRGSERFRRRHEVPRWAERIRSGVADRRTRGPLVLLAATVGLPPLAAVSLAAGAAGQRRREFAALCFVGRALRFAVLALPLAWSASRA